jgi:hypothetical protein
MQKGLLKQHSPELDFRPEIDKNEYMAQVPVFQSATPLSPSLNPQVVYSWKAPLRAYKKSSKNILRFYIAVALLLSLIIFFLGDRILIVPIWSVLFLFYVLTITPPPEVENKITKFGIETVGITLRWEALSHFYFTTRFGYTIITVVTHPPYNFHAYMVIPSSMIEKQVMRILAEHIVYQEKPNLTLTDRMIHWLSYLVPDDETDENGKDKAVRSGDKMSQIKDTLASFFQKQKDSSPRPQTAVPTE